ncbi:MAG: 4Fe-4S dicluster domain-containing protein [Deltaproteobacteria bacterium]|nr:4Fe-4S dicluster domain-containing protein [Deltaproteobacteria bacterium]
MAHNTIKSDYSELADRLNRFPQGAPPSALLFKILKMLFSEKEAELVSLMPIKPFTAKKASLIWKMSLTSTQKVLDELAGRAILVDIEQDEESVYALPPPMAGFFEFSLMRVRDDIDQKVLSELFYEYLNVEEDFVRELFTQGQTQLGRTFVHEPVLSNENALHVLDYELATEVIKSATHQGIGICYCRHKMHHVGRACKAPQEICMTFNSTAASLIKHGCARLIEKEECLDLLQMAYEHNLVQFGENVRERVNFICNCCGCCCEAMIVARRFAILNPVHTTNFIPVVTESDCNGCGKCVTACPVEAMTLVSSNNPVKPKMKVAKLDEDLCLGCGVCVRACSMDSIHLKSRPKRIITPLNGTHRAVVMAIERGKLQNLIFDNQVLWSHRAMAAVLGVILKLPPFKQTLANQQVKSRYLEALINYTEKMNLI